MAVGLKQHRSPVARPPARRSSLASSNVRRVTSPRGEGQHVDVAVAGARGREGEPLAVGRKQRPRFGRRMRHEQARFAAARRAPPRCRRRSRTRSSSRLERCRVPRMTATPTSTREAAEPGRPECRDEIQPPAGVRRHRRPSTASSSCSPTAQKAPVPGDARPPGGANDVSARRTPARAAGGRRRAVR